MDLQNGRSKLKNGSWIEKEEISYWNLQLLINADIKRVVLTSIAVNLEINTFLGLKLLDFVADLFWILELDGLVLFGKKL